MLQCARLRILSVRCMTLVAADRKGEEVAGCKQAPKQFVHVPAEAAPVPLNTALVAHTYRHLVVAAAGCRDMRLALGCRRPAAPAPAAAAAAAHTQLAVCNQMVAAAAVVATAGYTEVHMLAHCTEDLDCISLAAAACLAGFGRQSAVQCSASSIARNPHTNFHTRCKS